MSSNESTQDVTPGPDHDRRRLLAQIGVGGAIVWAAPAISGTALAQGTPSGCTPHTLDWNTFTTGSSSAYSLESFTNSCGSRSGRAIAASASS